MKEDVNKENENIQQEPQTNTALLIIGGIVTTIIIWFASGALIWTYFGKLENASLYGGIFGAVSALFSGLALAGIAITIYLQKQELSLQRLELKLTREELQRSAAAQEASERALKGQAAALEGSAEMAALSSVPAVTCDVSVSPFGNDHNFLLSIYNYGEIMAQALDVKIIARYQSLIEPASDFFQKQVKGWPEDFGHLIVGEEDYYSTYDNLNVELLSGRKQAKAQLAVFGEPLYVLVLLQFNDLRGINFYRLYEFWFGYSDTDNYVSVDLVKVNPKALKAAPRAVLGYVSKDRVNPPQTYLVSDEEMFELPEELSDFEEYWRDAIPNGRLKGFIRRTEPRVYISDIAITNYNFSAPTMVP